MSILVTPTLFNSVKWVEDSPASYKKDAIKQFHEMITRTKQMGTIPAVQRGVDFEDMVYKILRSDSQAKGSKHFNTILELCKGGAFQKTTKKIIRHGDKDYCLYGKIDVWFYDRIIDIKTTDDGHDDDYYFTKYLTTMQHHIYCCTENIPEFEYLVVLFDKKNKSQINKILTIPYSAELLKVEDYIKSKIDELTTFISSRPEWLDAWYTKYSKYN